VSVFLIACGWVFARTQATTQVGNEMLQREVVKAYEHKIKVEMEKKLMQVPCRVALRCT